MIKAILKDGSIEPLSELPAGWDDGHLLIVEAASEASNKDPAAALPTDLEHISNHDRAALEAALSKYRVEQKESMRCEMEVS